MHINFTRLTMRVLETFALFSCRPPSLLLPPLITPGANADRFDHQKQTIKESRTCPPMAAAIAVGPSTEDTTVCSGANVVTYPPTLQRAHHPGGKKVNREEASVHSCNERADIVSPPKFREVLWIMAFFHIDREAMTADALRSSYQQGHKCLLTHARSYSSPLTVIFVAGSLMLSEVPSIYLLITTPFPLPSHRRQELGSQQPAQAAASRAGSQPSCSNTHGHYSWRMRGKASVWHKPRPRRESLRLQP
jgi:hypothetical protein